MLDFSFTPEQERLREMVREFAKKELAPKYSHWDKVEEFPKEQLVKMARLGIIGMQLPAKYGFWKIDVRYVMRDTPTFDNLYFLIPSSEFPVPKLK